MVRDRSPFQRLLGDHPVIPVVYNGSDCFTGTWLGVAAALFAPGQRHFDLADIAEPFPQWDISCEEICQLSRLDFFFPDKIILVL